MTDFSLPNLEDPRPWYYKVHQITSQDEYAWIRRRVNRDTARLSELHNEWVETKKEWWANLMGGVSTEDPVNKQWAIESEADRLRKSILFDNDSLSDFDRRLTQQGGESK
jgi:hypothetical protein